MPSGGKSDVGFTLFFGEIIGVKFVVRGHVLTYIVMLYILDPCVFHEVEDTTYSGLRLWWAGSHPLMTK